MRGNVVYSTNTTNKWLCLLSVKVFLTTEVKNCTLSHSTDQAKYELRLSMFFLSNNFQAWDIYSNQRNLVVMLFASLFLFDFSIEKPFSWNCIHFSFLGSLACISTFIIVFTQVPGLWKFCVTLARERCFWDGYVYTSKSAQLKLFMLSRLNTECTTVARTILASRQTR